MTASTTLIDLSGRYTDRQHSTGDHETDHALLAEKHGIPIKRVSVLRDREAGGRVSPGGPDGMWPDSPDMLVVAVGGYQGTYASIQGGDAESATGDFSYAHKLALRLAGGHEDDAAELVAIAHGVAANWIADENYARLHDTVKRELMERGSLTALEFGEVLARADGRYLTTGRVTDLRGDEGPCEKLWKETQGAIDLAEELAARKARLEELGVKVRSTKTHRKAAPKRKKPFASGFLEQAGKPGAAR